MTKKPTPNIDFEALGEEAAEEAWHMRQPWTEIVDKFMKTYDPELQAVAKTPEQLVHVTLLLRHEVTRQLVALVRTRISAAPDDVSPMVLRRLEAEVANLERHEDHLAVMIRHTESLAETRRNWWVPRVALAISFLALIVSLLALLKK